MDTNKMITVDYDDQKIDLLLVAHCDEDGEGFILASWWMIQENHLVYYSKEFRPGAITDCFRLISDFSHESAEGLIEDYS